MAENKDLKQLRIKTSAIKRIQKEYHGYKDEEQKQNFRIQKLLDSNADQHDINKQNEVLQETIKMYPNIIQRLTDALGDIQSWIDEKYNDPLINASEEKVIAEEAIIDAKDFLQNINSTQ